MFGGTSALVLVFLYLPLGLIVLYSFNETNINSWPFPGFSTQWFEKLCTTRCPRTPRSVGKIALLATAPALLLGTSMAFAFARYRFFGTRGGQLHCHAADHPARRDHGRRTGLVLPFHRAPTSRRRR